MQKAERKKILECMLKANETMSEENQYQIYVYADCLIQLCSDMEYKHAEAIWRYMITEERSQATSQEWAHYVYNLSKPDAHSDMLLELINNQEDEVESLHDASRNGIDYFLEKDFIDVKDFPTDA